MKNTFYNDFDTEVFGEGIPRPDDYRTPFQVDRDRIIYTSAFRRLQSKTQVFLSGEYDFYRTRLTHSLEVAQIGRSICAFLKQHSEYLGDDFFVDPELVEAACLAHDLGHPPFGHTGERTLHSLMADVGGFEGNAQTLRMLTETIYENPKEATRCGMRPTRALLDGVLKYKTLYSELENPPNHFVYDFQKRYLDFVYGTESYREWNPPGKPRDAFRSVECQIMDWADDTAYSLNDVVDGVNVGFLTIEKLERWASESGLDDEESGFIDGLLRAIREQRVEPTLGKKIGKFIGSASLVRDELNPMSEKTNRYHYRLSIKEDALKEARVYKKIALGLVFQSQQLQQLDYKGDNIIRNLFAVMRKFYLDGEAPAGHLRLLPPATERAVQECTDVKKRTRLICDHVASMTDGFANRTYKRFFDADFGSIVDLL